LSGHSKWSTIHRQKEAKDARRGQIFTKLGNAITIAIRAGGGITDPEKNFKLRLAIEKARAFNMPKENITRALRQAQGKLAGGKVEEVTYEGYGPGGVAVIVETVTDNKNRTTAEIKNIIERGGGSLAGPGAVLYQFQKAGLLTVKKGEKPSEQILKIMDLGVDDVEEASDAIEVYTRVEEVEKFKTALASAGFEVLGTEIISQPKTTIKITDKITAEKILNFMEPLEGQDDVQRVFANFDIAQEIIADF
jgi:YebC/PmpR family DNA-binding regulatory protein